MKNINKVKLKNIDGYLYKKESETGIVGLSVMPTDETNLNILAF